MQNLNELTKEVKRIKADIEEENKEFNRTLSKIKNEIVRILKLTKEEKELISIDYPYIVIGFVEDYMIDSTRLEKIPFRYHIICNSENNNECLLKINITYPKKERKDYNSQYVTVGTTD